MRKILCCSLIILVFLSLTIKKIEAKKDTKISAKVFFFYYHDLSKEDGKTNAFDFERVYLTYKRNLNQKLKVRITTDIGRINSITDLQWKTQEFMTTHAVDDESLAILDADTREEARQVDDRIQVFLKYAYLEWQKLIPNGSMILGLQETPTWKIHEEYWGYRGVQKTSMDLNKLGSSADIGLGLQGKLVDERLNYYFLLSNGPGHNHAEEDMYKKGHLRLTLDFLGEFAVSAYADYEVKDSETSNLTSDLFLGYGDAQFTVAGQYFARFYDRQHDYRARGFSVFGNAEILPRVILLGRFDWFDPDDGVEDDEHSLIISGIDYVPVSNVHFVLDGQFKSFSQPEKSSINAIFLHTIYEF